MPGVEGMGDRLELGLEGSSGGSAEHVRDVRKSLQPGGYSVDSDVMLPGFESQLCQYLCDSGGRSFKISVLQFPHL